MNEEQNVNLEDLFNEIDAVQDDNSFKATHGETKNGKEVIKDEFDLPEVNEEEELPIDTTPEDLKTPEQKQPVKQKEVKEPEVKTEENIENKNEEEVKEKPLNLSEIKKLFEEENKKKEDEKLAKEKAEAEKLAKEKEELERNEKEKLDREFDGSEVLSEEDKKLIEQVSENYPEIKKVFDSYDKKTQAMINKRIEVNVKNAVQHVLNEVVKYVGPMQQHFVSQVSEQKLNSFKQHHPDYSEDMRKDCETWIEEYPIANVKKGLEAALKSDDMNEVVELFNMYKQSKGITAQAQAVQQEQASKVLADKKKEEAKQALGAVASKNSSAKVSAKGNEETDLSKLFEEIVVKSK